MHYRLLFKYKEEGNGNNCRRLLRCNKTKEEKGNDNNLLLPTSL